MLPEWLWDGGLSFRKFLKIRLENREKLLTENKRSTFSLHSFQSRESLSLSETPSMIRAHSVSDLFERNVYSFDSDRAQYEFFDAPEDQQLSRNIQALDLEF